ncbi:hypothetical protein Tco_1135662 [Tanacetum coccineum]
MYYPRFTKVIIHYFLTQDKTLSWRNKIGMHTSKDDYLINTLRFVSAKEETQIYGAILPESLTSPEMKETKAYKTYFGFAIGATPPKKARKFKKPASPKLTTVLVSTEESTRKSKRVKRPAKKSIKAPSRGVVIRETPNMPLSKKKEKHEGLSQDSSKWFWYCHQNYSKCCKDDNNNDRDSSGEDNDQENASDDDKTQSDNDNEFDSEHEKDENESDSESDHEENEKFTDKAEGDEDEEMDYTTSQLYDDVDIRPNEPIDTDKGFVQEGGNNAAMTNVQQGNENPEITQVIEDTHVILTTVPQKTGVLVTSSYHSSDLATNFLKFLDIPYTDAEIVSPMDVHVHHEEVSNFTPLEIQRMVTESLEHDVLAKESYQPHSSYEAAAMLIEFKLKKILIDKMDKSESYLAAPEHRECYEGLKKSYDLDKTFFSTYDKVYSLKRSRKDKDKDEDPSAGSDRGLKKRKTNKDTESEKDLDMPQDQEENLGNDVEEPKEKVASKRDWFTKPSKPQEPTDPDWNIGKTPQQGQSQSWLMTLASSAEKPSKTFDELMITPIDFSAFIMNGLKINNLTQETLMLQDSFKKLDWENPEGDEYPFDLTKPLPLVMNGNHQKVPVDYFFNNDLKYLQGGVLTMTYTTSITKTKAAQYDLLGIEDMTFYGYARGLQSRHDVYSTKRIMAVTQVKVMRKHGYGYLEEIVVRKADNNLYRFKEGDFPRLRINDIEDMLLLVVQNWLTNLTGDDVSDFATALRMITRSLVIQKRAEDLQLRVESYQKKINVTKPQSTKFGIRKRDPFTPYQDPQGFIYVNNNGRNIFMRSDELYKFSNRTLNGLRTSLDDITKNI